MFRFRLRSTLTVLVTAPFLFACAEKSAATVEGPSHEVAASSQPASAQATPGKGESAADRDQQDPDGVVRRGELTAQSPITVVAALEQASGLDGKSVKVSGTVDQVCANKGCWFVLRADDEAHKGKTIRITSKGYRFFMPRSSVGQTAVVEGDLKVATLTQAEAQHLEDDRVGAEGGEAKKIEGDKVEVQIAAVGVEMRPAGG